VTSSAKADTVRASPPSKNTDSGAPPADSVQIRQLRWAEEARNCARMMSSSEPWLTLQRSFEQCMELLEDPSREVYVAAEGTRVLGFVILNMAGAFTGYIQTICVVEHERSRGIGRRLVDFAERRIFRDSPNVFLCVSSFNPRARVLYERLGYHLIGELKDYIVAGHSELLYRKTIAPIRDFRKDHKL
jgi:[ribosomal protein S18]-alanine N-acetyltransferase